MRETAEKAINISAEAFEITKEAINQQKNIRYLFYLGTNLMKDLF